MPRTWRRGVVLAMYAGFAVFLAIMYLGYSATPRWPWWLAVPAIVTFVATGYAFVRLAMAPGYAADTLDRFLDERQRLVRDRAYRVAYYVVTGLMILLSVGVIYIAGSEDTWSAWREPALFLPWAAFIVGSLPTAIVAWAEPDPPDEPGP
jgi:hypothetical protein